MFIETVANGTSVLTLPDFVNAVKSEFGEELKTFANAVDLVRVLEIAANEYDEDGSDEDMDEDMDESNAQGVEFGKATVNDEEKPNLDLIVFAPQTEITYVKRKLSTWPNTRDELRTITKFIEVLEAKDFLTQP